MELTLYDQTMTFLWSFMLGAAVTVIYILVEVAREISPPNNILIFAEDLIFSFIVSALNFFFALARTQGYIRWYVIAAQIIVFVLVYFTLGKLLKKFFGAVLGIWRFINGKVYMFFGKIFMKSSQKMLYAVKKLKK